MTKKAAPADIIKEALEIDRQLREAWKDFHAKRRATTKAGVEFGRLCKLAHDREVHKYVKKLGSRKGYLSFDEYIESIHGSSVSKGTIHTSMRLYSLTEGPNAMSAEEVAQIPKANAVKLAKHIPAEHRTADIVQAAKTTPIEKFPAKLQEKVNESLPPEKQKLIRITFHRNLHPDVVTKLEKTIERFMLLQGVVRDGNRELTLQEKAIYAICCAAETHASEELDAAERKAKAGLPVIEDDYDEEHPEVTRRRLEAESVQNERIM